jgi:predicted DNA-binding transcriptional regulator YafY
MSRAQRLLDLIQALRRHRRPVSAGVLARELEVSLRTIYRDIDALKGQGAHIDGEPGIGYVLRPGFLLPPLMFTEEEIEALVLGSRWVGVHGDGALRSAATNALAKIGSILPSDLREQLDLSALLVPPREEPAAGEARLPEIRQSIRRERKMRIAYVDVDGKPSERTVWPFALGFFDHARIVAAWCELRQDFRHFRTDRIASLEVRGERYPRRRGALLKEWREKEGTLKA